MLFRSREDGTFDTERFKAAVRIYITAQEIVVDNASYPTQEIAENSHIFRTLGLGYANLGALIMSYGLGYDTDEGRALAGAITGIMTGHAYEQSAKMAKAMAAAAVAGQSQLVRSLGSFGTVMVEGLLRSAKARSFMFWKRWAGSFSRQRAMMDW